MPSEDTQFPRQKINKGGKTKVTQEWRKMLEMAKQSDHYLKAYELIAKFAFTEEKQWAIRLFVEKFMPNVALEAPVSINLPTKLEGGKFDEYIEIVTTSLSKYGDFSKSDILNILTTLSKLKEVKVDSSKVDNIYSKFTHEDIIKMKAITDKYANESE